MAYGDGYSGGYGGTVAATPHPTVTVEVAFTTTPFVPPTWTDVSSKVVGGTVTRGRTSELDKIRAGQATVVLANEDRRFDPTHTTGLYYPNVLPMRRLRIRATYNAVTYDVFSGFIDRWEQSYDHPLVAHATVTATDGFKVLAAKDLPGSVYEAEVAGTTYAWWRLGDPQGSTFAAERVGQRHALAGGTLAGTTPTFGEPGLVSRDMTTSVTFTVNPTTGSYLEIPDSVTPLGSGGGIPTWSIGFVMKNEGGQVVNQYVYAQTAGDPSSNPPSQILVFLWNSTTGAAGKLEAMIRNSTGGTLSVTSTVRVDDGNPHQIHVVYGGGTDLRIYVDGVASGVGAGVAADTVDAPTRRMIGNIWFSDADTYWWRGHLQEFVLYGVPLGAATVAAISDARKVGGQWSGDTTGARVQRILNLIGWPPADRNVDTGESTLQPTSLNMNALAYLQKVEESEGGLLFVTADGKVRFRSRHGGFNLPSQATFGDGDDTELEYVDIGFDWSETLIYNEIRVSRADGAVHIAEDTTSQTSYGERTYTSDGLFYASDAESGDRANFLLSQYKNPVFRTTRMVVRPSGATEATLFPQVLGRELGDKLTVRRKPQNVGATIDQTVIIEGLRHEFRDLYWLTEYMLSPSSTSGTPGAGDADFLQLDDTDGPGLDYVRLAY